MGGCLGYEESYSSLLLSHYDPHDTKDSPYRLECRMAYKEHLIQPKAQEMTRSIDTNRAYVPYVPPKPTTSRPKCYLLLPEEVSKK
jgi:hypothetical protein